MIKDRKNKDVDTTPIGKVLLFLFSVILISTSAFAQQPYIIGSEDILEIRFWQDNNLDVLVRVTNDGRVSLDIIGEISAAGQTTVQLEREIIRQMSRYNSAISQVVVQVTEYNNQKVFISGQIQVSGKFTFEVIPDLWTIINEAGGVTEFGDLERVLIIRGGKNAGKVETVNVRALVATGRLNELPAIYSGDTIEIPRTPAGLPASILSQSQDLRNLFYVMGEVNMPGAITLEKNIDILDAIALAGGATPDANLGKAKIITKVGMGTQIKRVNLKKYTDEAIAGRVFIMPEDVIILPRKGGGFLGMGITEWMTVVGGISTFLLMADALELFGLGE